MSAAPLWGGGDFSRVNENGSARYLTNYDRACQTTGYIETIKVAQKLALILGDEPLRTGVLRPHPHLTYIVRWVYGNSDSADMNTLSDLYPLHRSEKLDVFTFGVDEEDWLIFDSAFPGSVGSRDGLPLQMPLGSAVIETYDYRPDRNTSFIIHMIAGRST